MSQYTYNKEHKSRARSLRRDQTEAEKLLWSKIRSRQLSGFKFRRQHPIDHFILDFYCEEKRLAIELDSSQHTDPKHRVYDKYRTQTQSRLGITVIRFWDNEVIKNIDTVLEVIKKGLGG